MKKNICLIIASTIFGCSSDNSSETPNNITDKKLIREVETNLVTNNSQTINYSYNNNVVVQSEKIESNGNVVKIVYNYTDNRIVGLNYFRNNIANGTKTFQYDFENRLIMRSDSNEDNTPLTYAYAYNSISQLIVIQNLVSGNINSRRGFEYHNTQGVINSLTETHYNSANTIVQRIDYISDSANSPYLNMFPRAFNEISFRFSVQNISRKTMLNGDIYTYEYIYNNNRPIQVIENLNGTPINKTVYTYQ